MRDFITVCIQLKPAKYKLINRASIKVIDKSLAGTAIIVFKDKTELCTHMPYDDVDYQINPIRIGDFMTIKIEDRDQVIRVSEIYRVTEADNLMAIIHLKDGQALVTTEDFDDFSFKLESINR